MTPNTDRAATVYYKALDANGRSCHGGTLRWSLPRWTGRRWVPGAWMPVISDPIACLRGYHACAGTTQLLDWLHERVYVIESQSPWLDHGDKVVTAGPVRLTAGTAWDDCTARLFAVACALDVLPLYEAECPDDPRPSDALVVAWRYAHGYATDMEMAVASASAGASAWESARASAWESAWASARASARESAWESARASASAWESAWAWESARADQSDRLARYLTGEVDV